jgi:lipopolysaccharide/colanic/teichoic acid biosynthesis glycosyltransferase
MSIAADSETTSLSSRERSHQHELLRRRDLRGPRGFGWDRAGERRRIIVTLTLLCSDLISAFIALALVANVFGSSSIETAALTALSVLVGLSMGSGLYSRYGLAPAERLRARFLGTVAFVGMFIVVAGPTLHPTAWIAAACQGILMFLLGYYAEALARQALIRRNLWGAATAFAGTGPAIEQAALLLSAIPDLGLRPVGDGRVGKDPASLDRDEIEFIIAATKADFARISNATRFAAFPPQVLLLQSTRRAKTFLAPGTISLAVGRNINAPLNRLMKRMIDLTVGIPAMLVALPVIGLLALLIKLFSPGPAFYTQVRVGLKNRPCRVVKLRTMHCDAERLLDHYLHSNEAARLEWERFCKLSRDPRILPYIGNVIRRMSLDELPQLWQVVRGDISLIGPRPFPAYHTDMFDPAFQKLRSNVRAGLTGFWQVSSRSNGDIEAQKVQDLYYIRNWSIWLDFYILLQTVPAVMGARGR